MTTGNNGGPQPQQTKLAKGKENWGGVYDLKIKTGNLNNNRAVLIQTVEHIFHWTSNDISEKSIRAFIRKSFSH